MPFSVMNFSLLYYLNNCNSTLLCRYIMWLPPFNLSFHICEGEGNGNPLQYSWLENSMDRGAWRATVQGVAKSQPELIDYHWHHRGQLPAMAMSQGTRIRFYSVVFAYVPSPTLSPSRTGSEVLFPITMLPIGSCRQMFLLDWTIPSSPQCSQTEGLMEPSLPRA